MVRITWIGLILSLCGTTSVDAQGVSTNGLFGSRTLGGTISPGNRSAFGSSSAMGGMSGMGSGGMNQSGAMGLVSGSERFIRDNRTAGQFVGSDNNDASFVGAMSGSSGVGGLGGGGLGAGGLGRGGLGGAGNFQLGGARGSQQMGRNGRNCAGVGTNSNRKINVRTTMEVGFRYSPPAIAEVQSRLTQRLNDDRIARVGMLEIRMQDRVATLRGRVASQDDRDLARRIAKMEPGVESVVDELTVVSSDLPLGSPSDRP